MLSKVIYPQNSTKYCKGWGRAFIIYQW